MKLTRADIAKLSDDALIDALRTYIDTLRTHLNYSLSEDTRKRLRADRQAGKLA